MKRVLKYTYNLLIRLFFKSVYETRETAAPITLKILFFQKFLGFNKKAYWPVSFTSTVSGVEFIKIGIGTAPGYANGCYIFANEESPIFIGDYTIMAPNVCLAAYNHNIYDYRSYEGKGGITIGNYCWISMNSSIMSGVKIGDHTIVASNTVVTKSFEEGYCILAGNPARIIKKIEKEFCVKYENDYKYYGFIKEKDFKKFREKKMKI